MHAGRPIANIPEIHFVRGYVRVPAQQNLIIAIVVLIKVLSQSVYPIKLELKFFAADLCSMRKISVDDSNAVNVCRDQPVGASAGSDGKPFWIAVSGSLVESIATPL